MTNQLRKSLPPLPDKMKNLPISSRGYPVPYFVAYFNGEPDFRVIDPRKIKSCIMEGRCWTCGQTFHHNETYAFVAGPLLAFNRASAEPPSHKECAEYAARACPFLLYPKAQRRESNLPEHHVTYAPGKMIADNPGMTVIWVTNDYRTIADRGQIMFEAGTPTEVLWYAAGAPATREHAAAALTQRLAELRISAGKMAQKDIQTFWRLETLATSYLPGA